MARKQVTNQWSTEAEIHANAVVGLVEVSEAVLGAKEVHDAICTPPLEKFHQYEIANSIVPARYVSGDFVITFEGNGAKYVVLGDLMGKGLSAAMWLTHVVDLVRRACELENSLSAMMQRLSREMHRSRIGVPLTSLFVARLEAGSPIVRYSCGGCPAAFLLRSDVSVTMLDYGGPILGAVDSAGYEEGTVEMRNGDTLVAVSDGILEVHHGHNFELRPDRVAYHMRDTAGKSALEVVSTLTDRVRQQMARFIDDLSVVAIKRTR